MMAFVRDLLCTITAYLFLACGVLYALRPKIGTDLLKRALVLLAVGLVLTIMLGR